MLLRDPQRARLDAAARALVLGCFLLILWLACRPYPGITHDARLYTLMGLARLRPESLGGDLMVRYGGQDAYTLFGPLAAALLQRFSVETVNLAVTLVGQAWWFAAAFLLLRRLLPDSKTVFVAFALLVATPLGYGAANVFHAAENFMTPRLLAEAAVLTALWLALDRRWVAALLLSLLALSLHPLMAAPGLLILAALALGARGPVIVAGLCIAGVLVATALAHAAPVGPIAVMDPAWLHLARQRAWFANVAEWNWRAWATAATVLVILLLAKPTFSDARARQLLTAAIAIMVAGVAVDAIGAGWGKVILILQGQASRWYWPAVVLAHAVGVHLALRAWRAGIASQAAVLFAAAALFIEFELYVVATAIAVALYLARERLPDAVARWARAAAAALLLVVLYPWLTTRLGTLAEGLDSDGPLLVVGSSWLRWEVPATLLALAWWSLLQRVPRPAFMALAVVPLTALLGLTAVADWGFGAYGHDNYERLAGWRAAIPPDAEVHWPVNPAAAWFLLERRSWVSSAQTAGVIFSRQTAFEALSRARAVQLITPPRTVFSRSRTFIDFGLTGVTLRSSCRHGPDFIVAPRRIKVPQAAAPVNLTGLDKDLGTGQLFYLYDCRAVRDAGTARLTDLLVQANDGFAG